MEPDVTHTKEDQLNFRNLNLRIPYPGIISAWENDNQVRVPDNTRWPTVDESVEDQDATEREEPAGDENTAPSFPQPLRRTAASLKTGKEVKMAVEHFTYQSAQHHTATPFPFLGDWARNAMTDCRGLLCGTFHATVYILGRG